MRSCLSLHLWNSPLIQLCFSLYFSPLFPCCLCICYILLIATHCISFYFVLLIYLKLGEIHLAFIIILFLLSLSYLLFNTSVIFIPPRSPFLCNFLLVFLFDNFNSCISLIASLKLSLLMANPVYEFILFRFDFFTLKFIHFYFQCISLSFHVNAI